MWSIGVTALVISSLVMTALVAYMDHFDVTWDDTEDPDEDAREALTSQRSQQQQQQSQQHALFNGPSIELTASSGIGAPAAPAAPAPQGEQQTVGYQESVGSNSRRQQVRVCADSVWHTAAASNHMNTWMLGSGSSLMIWQV